MPEVTPVASIAALRARLIELATSHAAGTMDDDAYRLARGEAERALADAVVAAPVDTWAAPVRRPMPRPSTVFSSVLVAIVFVIALGGYALTGVPSLAGIGAPLAPPPGPAPASAANPDESRAQGLQQIAAMVDKLAARLKDRPDDAEGWTMLARSYTVLSRYGEALPAYKRALELQPQSAPLMADYADAIAAANGNQPTAESNALIARALAIDPKQPKALALAGTLAFDRGDFAGAAAQWQKIIDVLPPDSEFRQQVQANVDEARRRGNLPAAPAAPVATANPATSVSGTVTLAPALAKRVAPTDTVFVFARNAEGGRMPLAVYRATVADLPLRFKLDDSMAMAPTMKLSGASRVIVGARISKSGNAIPQPGDFAGETAAVAPGAKDLAIAIEQERTGDSSRTN